MAAISFSSVGRNPIAEGLDAVAVPLKWAISMQEYSYRYTRYNHNNKMDVLELEYSCRLAIYLNLDINTGWWEILIEVLVIYIYIYI